MAVDDSLPDDMTAGEAALRAAIEDHGEALAGALDHADQVRDLVDLIVLVIAAVDEDEVEDVTESLASLVRVADELSTDESVALAAAMGEHGREAASALETVLELERDGQLEELVALADALSGLEVDESSVEGVNRLLGAVGEAEQASFPVGLWGWWRASRTPPVRAGLGYFLAILRAQGRRLLEE